MRATAPASSPLATKLLRNTLAFLALETNHRPCGCRAKAALRPCRSRRPCVATTTNGIELSCAQTAGASSLDKTVSASGKSPACAAWATTATRKPTRGAKLTKARATGESPTTARVAEGKTGSMNNSRVPPEWQAMPNSSTSPRSRSALSSEGEMRIFRGCPSSRALRTVLRTAGWAQPPPIQPWIWPSAMTTALSPALPEVGACALNTVTKAKA